MSKVLLQKDLQEPTVSLSCDGKMKQHIKVHRMSTVLLKRKLQGPTVPYSCDELMMQHMKVYRTSTVLLENELQEPRGPALVIGRCYKTHKGPQNAISTVGDGNVGPAEICSSDCKTLQHAKNHGN